MSRKFDHRKKESEQRGVPVKKVPYSNRLKAQIKKVARIHTKIDNIRDHHHKKTAAVIASRYSHVAVEEHGVKFMIRNRRLSKLASDRAIHKQWGAERNGAGTGRKRRDCHRHRVGDERVLHKRRNCSIMAPSHARAIVRLRVKR